MSAPGTPKASEAPELIPLCAPTKAPEERLWGKVIKGGLDDCWEWQGARSPRMGHGRTMHYRDGKRIWTQAHRLAWELTRGDIPEGLMVCHRCDNPPCCNPDHLFLGTAADNAADRDAKGRHGSVRISDERVAELRARYVRHFTPQLSRSGTPNKGGKMRSNSRELAEEFGISQSHLQDIVAGYFRKQVQ